MPSANPFREADEAELLIADFAIEAMALAQLSGDAQRIIFSQLCNPLDPGVAVAFSSTSSELRELTRAPRKQLKADYKAATRLSSKLGEAGCKGLREAKKVVRMHGRGSLEPKDLALLGTLGSVLPALEKLTLGSQGGLEGMQPLAEKLGAGALPAVTTLVFCFMRVGDAGASALAAALGRGALPRLKLLSLGPPMPRCRDVAMAIGDAGLVALAPALQRRPALEALELGNNPFGDEGLAALVAPPPQAGALPLPTGVLPKLERLDLRYTRITDDGCAALAAALDSGALPALERVCLDGIPASDAAKAAVDEALLTRSLAAAALS